MSEFRAGAKQAGIPVRGQLTTIAWLTETDHDVARDRWPGWVDGLNQDEPFDERRARMSGVCASVVRMGTARSWS